MSDFVGFLKTSRILVDLTAKLTTGSLPDHYRITTGAQSRSTCYFSSIFRVYEKYLEYIFFMLCRF